MGRDRLAGRKCRFRLFCVNCMGFVRAERMREERREGGAVKWRREIGQGRELRVARGEKDGELGGGVTNTRLNFQRALVLGG